jgi:hypothetical protein
MAMELVSIENCNVFILRMVLESSLLSWGLIRFYFWWCFVCCLGVAVGGRGFGSAGSVEFVLS